MNFPQLSAVPTKRSWQRRERYEETCRNCGASFQAGESHGRHQTGARFCSKLCQHLWGVGPEPLPLSPTTAAYIAGLLDGEGSISLMRNSSMKRVIHLKLQISNTHEGVLRWVKIVTGVGGVWRLNSHRPNDKMCYGWSMSGRGAEQLLRQIRPYLIIKADRADFAFAFQHRRRELLDDSPEWQEQAAVEMRLLNKRGVA